MNFMEMDWLSPPPEPTPFVGGMHRLPEGRTGYFPKILHLAPEEPCDQRMHPHSWLHSP